MVLATCVPRYSMVSPMALPMPEKISPSQSNIGFHRPFRRGYNAAPTHKIDQIYRGAVRVKMRQANSMQGAANSN